MKVTMIKNAGGIMSPASEIEAERLKRFKNDLAYEIEIKGGEKRSRGFHGKVFAFFNFCFQYWCANSAGHEFKCESAQFEIFRHELTILAGYRDVVYTINGEARVRAKSLSYDSMSQDEFEQLYSALISAAIANLFQGASDDVCNKLYSFF